MVRPIQDPPKREDAGKAFPPRPVGRPTKYDPAYCDAVVDHMANGSSLTSFAASINVARSTINEWISQFPEFSEACSRAKAKCAVWWEEAGRNLVMTGGSSAQGALIQFGLKNMSSDDWKDASQIDHRSGDGSMSPKGLSDFYARKSDKD